MNIDYSTFGTRGLLVYYVAGLPQFSRYRTPEKEQPKAYLNLNHPKSFVGLAVYAVLDSSILRHSVSRSPVRKDLCGPSKHRRTKSGSKPPPLFSYRGQLYNPKGAAFDTLVSCGQLQTKTSGPHRAAQVAFPPAPHFSASNYPIQPITSSTSSSAVRTLVQVDATITGLRNAFCALALCPRLGNCWSLS
jgi:hypothetical protein